MNLCFKTVHFLEFFKSVFHYFPGINGKISQKNNQCQYWPRISQSPHVSICLAISKPNPDHTAKSKSDSLWSARIRSWAVCWCGERCRLTAERFPGSNPDCVLPVHAWLSLSAPTSSYDPKTCMLG